MPKYYASNLPSQVHWIKRNAFCEPYKFILKVNKLMNPLMFYHRNVTNSSKNPFNFLWFFSYTEIPAPSTTTIVSVARTTIVPHRKFRKKGKIPNGKYTYIKSRKIYIQKVNLYIVFHHCIPVLYKEKWLKNFVHESA